MINKFSSRPRAFTLVEAAICVAIVGILLVASTATFSSIAKARTIQAESRIAYLLGQQLLAEISQSYFQQQSSSGGTQPLISASFGPTAGQLRSTFTAVDQYDGYSASPPVTKSGTALASYTGWTESVSVTFVDPASFATTASGTTLKKIVVTISAPSGKKYILTGLRSLYGAYETPPATLTTYVTGVTSVIQGTSPAKPIYSGAHPLNITTSQ